MLGLESEVNQWPGSIPNPNLHIIARSDRIGFKTKNPSVRDFLSVALVP